MTKSKRILLLGSYGRGNIGDDAFLVACVRLFAGHRITINAAKDAPLPAEVVGKIDTFVTGSMKDFWLTFRVFLSADAIVYGGGDLWVILYGATRPRRSLWIMALLNPAARILGKKVMYLGCGAGSLSGFSLMLARISAHVANGVIARDANTLRLLRLKHGSVLPDLTVTLQPKRPVSREVRWPIRIAISVLYYLPNAKSSFNSYTEGIAGLIRRLDPSKYQIKLLPLFVAKGDPRNDAWACEQVQRRVGEAGNVEVLQSDSLQECLGHLRKADIVIGTRLHANILATWLGKPCIGIAYRPKVKSFFQENGMIEQCISLGQLSKLKALVDDLATNYDEYARRAKTIADLNADKGKEYERFVQAAL